MVHGKFYDAHLSQSDSEVIRKIDEGQFDTFTEALATVVNHLAAEANRSYQSDDRDEFRRLVDRLAWFSLGHQDIGAYAPGGGDFGQSEDIMAKRSRVWKENPKKPYEVSGFVGMVDASGHFDIKEGQGRAYAKDAKAQVAAVLRELALTSDASPALSLQAIRSLGELVSGTLVDFAPKDWDKNLGSWTNVESFRPFGTSVVDVIPGGPSPAEAAALIVHAHASQSIISDDFEENTGPSLR